MSIIKSKDYVPYFYRNSRDYQVFLNLIDLILNVIKINIDTIPDNHDPTKCNYLLLELLSSFVGYDYDHKEDEALFYDGQFITRKLECLKTAFETYKEAESLIFQLLEVVLDRPTADSLKPFVDYLKTGCKPEKEVTEDDQHDNADGETCA